MKTNFLLITAVLLGLLSQFSFAQEVSPVNIPNYSKEIQKEKLGRGLVALHQGDGVVTVSWRLLESDSLDTAFDIYRQSKKGKAVKVNSSPIINSTFFKDSLVKIETDQTYILKKHKETQALAQYTLTPKIAQKPYFVIPMQAVVGDSLWKYAPNDATVADLDGDGEYELIIKRENGGFDNSHRGLAKGGCLIEAYKLDGTFMWRMNLGMNIRQGAHYTQLMVFDFDGDGKAEIAVKTAEGTTFGDGTTIGDTNNDGRTDYVDRNPDSKTYGMITEGPEFLSVIKGTTGKELARTNFISRGMPFEFGDNQGNRVDRFLGGAGYFDGLRPSILICRGYYAKTVLEAWDFRDGKLSKRWTFSTTDDNGLYKSYEGQGNHNLSIGDVDGDGKDEITYGACMIDHDGTGGYNTFLGHGDAMHLTDIDIDRPGLEVWTCHESAPSRAGSELRDAHSGQLIWGIPAHEDVGRALAADIDPRFRGVEVWTIASGGVYTADGRFISERTPSINMALWWDGDLNRELLDGSGVPNRESVRIAKWNGDGTDRMPLPDGEEIAMNNHTKANPNLHADVLGDWREELIVRTKNNREVRIYVTPHETQHRFFTLMSDPIYRWSVLTQNIAYNQPTQPGLYLGSDLGKFWPSYYTNLQGHGKKGETEDGRPNGMNARLKGAELIEVKNIETQNNSYTLDARYNYDTYEWTIDGKRIEAGRTVELKAADYGLNRKIQVKLRASIHGGVFEDEGTIEFR